jgi:DNA-binding CsgD family transcriptional regulator
MEKTIVRKSDVVTITQREIDTFQMIADEKSREEIAAIYNQSRRTVEAFIYRTMAKVGTTTQEGTIALFFRNDLIK